MKKQSLLIVAIIAMLTATSAAATSGQVQLTIDNTKVTSTLSDFPVSIHLGSASGLNGADTSAVLSALGTNNKKFSISTDKEGNNKCFVEIEKWDPANKQAFLWVKVPSLTPSTTLFLIYDSDMPDNTAFIGDTGSSQANQVWSNGFTAVYHFAEQGTGVAGEYKDSTGRGHDGRAANAVRSTGSHPGKAPTRVDSKIGFGGYYDGGSTGSWPCIQIPDSDDFSITTTNKFTMSFWWNAQSTKWKNAPVKNSDTFIHPIGKIKDYDSKAAEWQWVLESYPVEDDSPGVSRFYQFSPNAGYGAAADNYEPYAANEWHYDTCICTSTDATHGQADHYVDTSHNTGMTDWQEYGVNYKNGIAPVYVGTSTFEDLEELNNCFYGQIDELEFSNVVRSAAWVKAGYYSGKDQLLKITVSNETVTPPVTPPENNTTQPPENNTTPPVTPPEVNETQPPVTPPEVNETQPPVVIPPVLPTANFKISAQSGYVPFSVKFTDLSKDTSDWTWDFGDGATSTDQNPTHIYSNAGLYQVALFVANKDGIDSKTVMIEVKEKPISTIPTADFEASVYTGRVPLKVSFTDTSTGNATSWRWNFGDGDDSRNKNPTHSFGDYGKFNVVLTVKNDFGSSKVTKIVTVKRR